MSVRRNGRTIYCIVGGMSAVELCVGTVATIACVPSVTAHGQATYDSGAPAIEKTWASIA